MNRLLIAGAIVLLSGCAMLSRSASQSPTPPPAPAVRAELAGLPRIVHRVMLADPPGQGVIELREEVEAQGAAERPVFRAYGGILAGDDLARWRFTYTKTSLEGPGPGPGGWLEGLHAMSVILVNAGRGDIELDWEKSRFVDASGRSQRMIHRGIQLNQRSSQMLPSTISAGGTLNEFVFPGDTITFSAPGRASVWNSPAVFERLAPGHEFSIVLNLQSGGQPAPRTFRFTVVPPPTVTPAPIVVPAPAPAAPR
jgi:hypothetical protein